ncbi:copper resistance protein CopZ [Rhodobacterales bacterium 52_120_T64]|nr:copper resistance protein CopZ [Rhodobacterales bacterium 52_120_T64]
MKLALAAILPLVFLMGCKDDVADIAAPDPLILTAEAAGHYCQMEILEHQGPKAQVHIEGFLAPLWFSQVRDGIAYLKSQEQSAEIVVIYVNDMGEAASWQAPGAENWMDVNDAYFVVNSDVTGGMGAPELAPFSDLEKAQTFMAAHGGEIMRLAEIPAELVLAPVEFDTAALETSE